MIQSNFIALLQEKVNTALPSDYSCKIFDEVDYSLSEIDNSKIEANLLWGSVHKTDDLSDRMVIDFVINIFSEKNGASVAKQTFDTVFTDLAKTYQTLGEYKAKIEITSPTLNNSFKDFEEGYTNEYIATGSILFTKNMMLGARFYLAINSGAYEEIKPQAPTNEKELLYASRDLSLNGTSGINSTGNAYKFSTSIFVKNDFNGALPSGIHSNLLKECFDATTNKYKLKIVFSNDYTIEKTNLIITSAKFNFVEETGDVIVAFCLEKEA